MNQPSPSSRRALITGARGQLGSALVEEFGEAGWTVVPAARPRGEMTEARSGRAGEPIDLDLHDDEQVGAAAAALLEGVGDDHHLGLVCNATTREPLRSWREATREDFHQLYDVDVVGHFLLARAVAEGARAAGASAAIVFVSSIYGVGGVHERLYPEGMNPGSTQYAAAKGALVSLARDLAGRWGRDGVRVNAVVPGGIRAGQDPEFVGAYEELTQLGRMAEAAEVASVIEMACSERSSYLTGQAIGVDGGWTAW
jgi:NAD(P)-dependent dehydrogenase (short-subunit alcohol dehydrogenase family)